jgi:hypothetical protein
VKPIGDYHLAFIYALMPRDDFAGIGNNDFRHVGVHPDLSGIRQSVQRLRHTAGLPQDLARGGATGADPEPKRHGLIAHRTLRSISSHIGMFTAETIVVPARTFGIAHAHHKPYGRIT